MPQKGRGLSGEGPDFVGFPECSQRPWGAYSEGAFRNIAKGALVTGCRYGELTRMRAADFNAEAGTIAVRESKSGKPRHVVLTDEGRAIFAELTAGRSGRDLVFVRDDGKGWGPSHQQRPLDAASARAKLEPAATFLILRHTYASALAMRGVPMGVIAAQLGHADRSRPALLPEWRRSQSISLSARAPSASVRKTAPAALLRPRLLQSASTSSRHCPATPT